MKKLAIVFVLSCSAFAQTHADWSGLLVDAGCLNRDPENLLMPPTQELATLRSPAKQAAGISVSPQVLKAERADVTLPDTPDHASRYSSASCAITADTKAFALFAGNGL